MSYLAELALVASDVHGLEEVLALDLDLGVGRAELGTLILPTTTTLSGAGHDMPESLRAGERRDEACLHSQQRAGAGHVKHGAGCVYIVRVRVTRVFRPR